MRGRLVEVTHFDGPLYTRVHDLAKPWLSGNRSHVLRLDAISVSGRRVPASG